jgi:hypothetical protein
MGASPQTPGLAALEINEYRLRSPFKNAIDVTVVITQEVICIEKACCEIIAQPGQLVRVMYQDG